eukprot:358344-Chlamydomonas_euryale.AAC.4
MQYMHEVPRAFPLMGNQGWVVRAQNMRRDRRSRPMMPAEAKPGPGPRTCMHVNAPSPEAKGRLHACINAIYSV